MSPVIYHMNYLQALVIGLIQGLTELFPISSLGHTVLIPSWLGGNWATLVRQENLSESPYLAFVVGLHLATAVVLLGFYWRDWVRLIKAIVSSIVRRRVSTTDERLAWLIVIATIPVGLLGLGLEHLFRTLFAKPLAAAIFLTANGLILFAAERYRRRPAVREQAAPPLYRGASEPARGRAAGAVEVDIDERVARDEALSRIGGWNAFWIGAAQSLALLAGISREGVAMAGGLFRGLTREDALRFAFMLSTPVIFAAGALKIGDLTGPLGAGIRGQVIVGSLAAAATSLFAVVFLSRYFKTRTLYPFAVYCLLAGGISVIRFGLF